jgi:hypothetical protein
LVKSSQRRPCEFVAAQQLLDSFVEEDRNTSRTARVILVGDHRYPTNKQTPLLGYLSSTPGIYQSTPHKIRNCEGPLRAGAQTIPSLTLALDF